MTGDMHDQVQGEEGSAYAALVLGTRDYVRKCGFKKVVVGLSGGIDSALTAVIAVDALGAENVIGVSMPSQYSSGGSITDARELATNLGICFDVVAIRDIFESYRTALSTIFKGLAEDVTEENLQARTRGGLLMASPISFRLSSSPPATRAKSASATAPCMETWSADWPSSPTYPKLSSIASPATSIRAARRHSRGIHHQAALRRVASRPEG